MALAYPEGECFFRRAVLNGGNSEGYNADNRKDFASHLMVEYVWNREADHAAKACNSPAGYCHPRSGYKIVRGAWWDTDYGCWTQLPFQYGPKRGDIRWRAQHNLCTNGNRFRDREKGGADESWFMIMPMPDREERWVWIDRMAHIRAIYFPVAYSVDKDHPDLCSFVQVNFALPRKIKFACNDNDKDWSEVQCDKVLGLTANPRLSIAFDVTGLIELLSLPRQLRKDNCYNLRLIKMFFTGHINTAPLVRLYEDGADKSWTTIAGGNYGLDLIWRPCEKSTWAENYIRNTLIITVGFIPAVGPILQAFFTVGWELLINDDPQAAYQTLKSLCPALDLGDKLINELLRTAKETRSFMPDGWDKMGLEFKQKVHEDTLAPRPIEEDMDKKLPMLLQGEILANSGTPNEQPKEDEAPGEVVKENPEGATEGVENLATDIE